MSATARAWCLLAAVCVGVLALDQVSKAIIEANLVPGEMVSVVGPLDLTLTHNRGIAFGLAGGAGLPLIGFVAIALGFVVYLFSREPARPWMWLAGGLVCGGAIGNLIDRVRAGEVTDFIHLPSWPAFNVADIAVSCGVVLLVLLLTTAKDAESPAGD